MRTFVATIVYVILCALAVCSAPSPQSPSPQSTLSQSPASKPPDLAAAKLIFESHCALCHGIDGGGGRGPSLRRPKLAHAADDEALRSLIENGIPPEMPEAWFLSKEEIAGVAAYVRSLGNVPPETLPGEAARGKVIYARSGCSVCHILDGEGSGYGPELTDLGTRCGSADARKLLSNLKEHSTRGYDSGCDLADV